MEARHHAPSRISSHVAFLTGCALALAFCGTPSAQEFSQGPDTTEWSFGQWSGYHELTSVYCLTFPRPRDALSETSGFLGNDTISYYRVVYADRIAAYVITSTLPAGRKEDDEFARMLAREQANADLVGDRYRVSHSDSGAGRTIALRLTDIAEAGPDGVFPVARPLLADHDGPLRSLSVRRLFVRGTDRYELVVLGVLDAASGPEERAVIEQKMSVLVDKMMTSLESCQVR